MTKQPLSQGLYSNSAVEKLYIGRSTSRSLPWTTLPLTMRRSLSMRLGVTMKKTRSQILMNTSCSSQAKAEYGLSRYVPPLITPLPTAQQTFPDSQVPDGTLVQVRRGGCTACQDPDIRRPAWRGPAHRSARAVGRRRG